MPSSGQPVWNKSSFVYLNPAGPNASDYGFNQSHFYQQTKSTYERVILDSASRSLKYGQVTNNLFVRQGTWITSGAVQEGALSIAVNGIASIRLCCWYSSLVINVLIRFHLSLGKIKHYKEITIPSALVWGYMKVPLTLVAVM